MTRRRALLAKGIALTIVLLGVVLGVIVYALAVPEYAVLGLVNTLLNLGMLVCFIRSMQLTAEAVGEVDHAARARLALVLAGVVAILQIGSTVLAATSTDPHGIGAVAGLLGIAFLGIGIWMLVNYLMVIYGLSQSIARHVDLSRSFD